MDVLWKRRRGGDAARPFALAVTAFAKGRRSILGAPIALLSLCVAASAESAAPTPPVDMTLAEIESCASENLPGNSGVIGFRVDAVDRSGATTSSKAELRWLREDDAPMRVLLEVSEPAKTAGTALLIIERDAAQPEFFVRLPEMKKVKKIRSRRLRGPVPGTDFSYEDLDRLRSPVDKTSLELIGTKEVGGAAAWILETIPREEDSSEYSRVLTFVDHATCLPIRIDLFEEGRDGVPRLRKRLEAPRGGIRNAAGSSNGRLPYVFEMRDMKRETRTSVQIERFEIDDNLPAEQFTRAALQETKSETSPAAPR